MKHKIKNLYGKGQSYFRVVFLHDKHLQRDMVMLGMTILASGIFLVTSLNASVNIAEKNKIEDVVEQVIVPEIIEDQTYTKIDIESDPVEVVMEKPKEEIVVAKPAPIVRRAVKPRAPMPISFKKSAGLLVCDKKNDHPSKSKKNKGKHMDMECCLDPDEYPNPNCHYSESKYGKYL